MAVTTTTPLNFRGAAREALDFYWSVFGGRVVRWIVTAVEGSLRRLRTGYVDLCRIHHPAPHTDIKESLRTP